MNKGEKRASSREQQGRKVDASEANFAAAMQCDEMLKGQRARGAVAGLQFHVQGLIERLFFT